MGPKKLFDFQGRKVQGQSIEFEPKAEPWGQYALEDGTELKVKVVLCEVVRLDEFNDKGDPVYQFGFQQIIGAVVPEALKRKSN